MVLHASFSFSILVAADRGLMDRNFLSVLCGFLQSRCCSLKDEGA